MHFRSQTFVPISWMCKKQTSVSHSSTEAAIISLDAGLRKDGIPACDLWDLEIEIFHSSPNQLNNTKGQVQGNSSRNTTANKHTQNKTKVLTQHDNFDLNNVDCVPLNAKFSRFGAMLYIFDDNENVIKMIIKGRSPTMRHVSRTHRVALDWLFDRINLEPKIQIKYIDTKNQLADMLTKGISQAMSGTIFFICSTSAISALCCAQNFSLTSCTKTDDEKDARTGRRRQQDRGKVKADDDESGFLCLDKFFDCEQSDCVEKPGGYSKHFVEQIGQVQGNLTEEIAITTQRRVLEDGTKTHFWR